jgi:hypothetical protein
MFVDLPKDFDAPLTIRWEEMRKHDVAEGRKDIGPWPFGAVARLAPGFYQAHVNFNHDLDTAGILKNEYPFSPWQRDSHDEYDFGSPEAIKLFSEGPWDYGICDSWCQIMMKWPELAVDPRHFIVFLSPQIKCEGSDFRWHKWGSYIGVLGEPTREHFKDEPDFEEVSFFHIVEVNV